MKSGLTPRQARTIEFIRGYIADKGWSPSFDEIAAAIGCRSKSGAHRIVYGLVDRGFLTRRPHLRRSIEIVTQPRAPEGIDFLPHELAVWVRVLAARAGVSSLEVVTECVRDAYNERRKPELTAKSVSREASATGKVAA